VRSLGQGCLFGIYGGEANAANSAWLPHKCGETISPSDAAEMAGQLAILGFFEPFLFFWGGGGYFGDIGQIFGHFWAGSAN
jgi:hypothetical protein